MKNFITRLIIFLLPLLLLAYPLDMLLTNALKNSHEYAGEIEVWNDIYDGKINADILIYGSSRAWKHINPQILEDSLGLSTYNLGMDGHIFWSQYFRHQTYLLHNLTPKMIVLSLDIFSLETNKNIGLYNKNQFLPYMYCNETMHEYTKPYKGFSWVDFNVPLIRYLFNQKATLHALMSIVALNKKPYRNKGYKGFDVLWDYNFEKAKLKKENYYATTDGAAVNLLEQFISECATKKIELLLIYSPEYIAGQQFTKHREDVMKTYTTLASKHHLQFIDYSSNEICYRKELFFNALHLNLKGSEIFSKTLAADLKNYKKAHYYF